MSISLLTWNIRGKRINAAFTSASDKLGAAIDSWASKRNLTLVPNTVKRIDTGAFGVAVAGAILFPSKVTKQKQPAVLARMVNVATNMFMDADKSVWKEEGGVLVRQQNETPEYLESLLARSCPTNHAMASDAPRVQTVLANTYGGKTPVPGTYGYAVHNNQTFAGAIVATDNDVALMLPYSSYGKLKPIEVNASDILECRQYSDFDGATGTKFRPKTTAATAPEALDYYNKVYQYSPEYFDKLSQIIRQSWNG